MRAVIAASRTLGGQVNVRFPLMCQVGKILDRVPLEERAVRGTLIPRVPPEGKKIAWAEPYSFDPRLVTC